MAKLRNQEVEIKPVPQERRLSERRSIVGRMDEVLRILRSNQRVSVKDLSIHIGISERNVSSQLSYLRKRGIRINSDSLGRKFIE